MGAMYPWKMAPSMGASGVSSLVFSPPVSPGQLPVAEVRGFPDSVRVPWFHRLSPPGLAGAPRATCGRSESTHLSVASGGAWRSVWRSVRRSGWFGAPLAELLRRGWFFGRVIWCGLAEMASAKWMIPKGFVGEIW